MAQYVFEQGYEGKQIINPKTVNLETLKTDRDYIVTYAELSKASHWRKDPQKGNLASDKSRQIVDEVRTRLEKAGWHVHIFANGSVHDRCNVEMYLHAFIGMPEVSEVPFANGGNLELTETELFNADGSLKPMNESLELLRKRIGEQPLNLDTMLENNEIDKEVADTIKAIMTEEGLTEIHELDEAERTFRSGPKEYTWRNNEDEAEAEAKDYLEEDKDMWIEAVKAGNTTSGFDDWQEEVLNVDGWEHVLCGYDGQAHELSDGKVYWRTN
jgi:hypothetical protein